MSERCQKLEGATGPRARSPLRNWSGRPDSNRRRPAWEAGILPLNYARGHSKDAPPPVPPSTVPFKGTPLEQYENLLTPPRVPSLSAPRPITLPLERGSTHVTTSYEGGLMTKLINFAAATAVALAACSSDRPMTGPAGSLDPSFSASAPASVRNSGFYDHQFIEYEGTAEVTSSPQAAQLISQGNVVFHIVGPDGNTPAVQCARLLATLPNDATSCNV